MIFQGKGGGINSSQQAIKKEKYKKLTAKEGGGRSYRALKWDQVNLNIHAAILESSSTEITTVKVEI